MEQIVSLPWEGPLVVELLEEAASRVGKTIFVARNVRRLTKHLKSASVQPDLLIVDGAWAPGLLSVMSGHDSLFCGIPTILVQFEHTDASDSLASKLNTIAVISPRQHFTAELSELISAFYECRSTLGTSAPIDAAAFAPAMRSVQAEWARDKSIFRDALRRQDEKQKPHLIRN